MNEWIKEEIIMTTKVSKQNYDRSVIFLIVLILGFLPFSLFCGDCEYNEDDSYLRSQQDACTSIDGSWDCQLNRCIPNQQKKESANDIEICHSISDDQKRNLCYEQVAKEMSDFKIDTQSEEQATSLANQMKYWGLVNLVIAAVVGDANSSCLSMNIFSKVGMGHALASLGTYLFMDEDTDELREKYLAQIKDGKSNQTPYEAQKGAFEFLLKEQKSMKSAVNRQELIHRFTAYGYSAASVIGVLEGMNVINTKGCQTKFNKGQSGTVELLATQTAKTQESATAVTTKPLLDSKSGKLIDFKPAYQNVINEAATGMIDRLKSNEKAKNQEDSSPRSKPEDIPSEQEKSSDDNDQDDSTNNDTSYLPTDLFQSPVHDVDDNWFEKWTAPTEMQKAQGFGYVGINRDLYQLIHESKGDLDAIMNYLDFLQEFQGQVQSVSIHRYHAFQKDHIFTNQSVQIQTLLSEILKLEKQIIDQVIPKAHAKSDLGTKLKNVAIGNQGLNADTIFFGGGVVGAALRGMTLSYAIRALAPGLQKTLTPYLSHPFGIAAISAISAWFQYRLAANAKVQLKVIEDNIDALEETMGHLEIIAGRYCLKGRDDLADPGCYCYNEDGTRNENHENSSTCKSYWTRNDQSLFQESYARSYTSTQDKMGCITLNGVYDPECKCVDYKDKASGKNACMKAGFTNGSLPNLGASVGLSDLASSLNSVYSGDSTSLGVVNNDGTANLAANTKKLQEKLFKQANDQRIKQGQNPLPLTPKEYEKAFNGLLSQTPVHPQSAQDFRSSLGSFDQNLPEPAQKAIELAMNKAGLYSTGKGSLARIKKNDEFDLNFANQVKGANKSGRVQEGFMDKSYKYKNSDIHQQSGSTLFQIISKRYQSSAFDRLDLLE